VNFKVFVILCNCVALYSYKNKNKVSPSYGSFGGMGKLRQVSEVSKLPKPKPKKGETFRQSQNSFAHNTN
jgi:hypothetical protein